MIVEGIVTSTDARGSLNVAPMGPIIHGDFSALTLRPFQSSTTCRNLQETRCGVFHVVDQVDLIAQTAIGRLTQNPATEAATCVQGRRLLDCCRWFEFRITHTDLSQQRTEMQAEIVDQGERRPFFGFNRARHAVLEAAILATRVHLLPAADIIAQLTVLQSAVSKTGGPAEQAAFAMLQQHIDHNCGQTT